MSGRSSYWLASIVLSLASTIGCDTNIERQCSGDIECLSGSLGLGLCLDVGDGRHYCAEYVVGCPSRWRWGIGAAEEYRLKCITPDKIPKDGGVDGPSTDAGSD